MRDFEEELDNWRVVSWGVDEFNLELDRKELEMELRELEGKRT